MIAYRNTGVNAVTAGTTSTTVTLPAGTQQNDLLIAWCEIGSIVTNFNVPAGWTQFSWSPVVDGVNSNAFAFWKIAGAGETNPTVSWTTSSKAVIICVGYSGVDTTTPIGNSNVNIETVNQTTATTPTLAATANEWAVTIHSSRTSTSANKSPTWTAPSGETSRNQADNGAAAAAPWSAVANFDSNGVVSVANHSYTATSNFSESHHKSALIYINNVAPQLTETITTSDAVTRTLSLTRNVTDAFTTSDSVTRAIVLPRSLTDGVTTADAATDQVALQRAVADGWLTADEATRSIVVSRSATDSWATTDAATGTVEHPDLAIFTLGVPGTPWSWADPGTPWQFTQPAPTWSMGAP